MKKVVILLVLFLACSSKEQVKIETWQGAPPVEVEQNIEKVEKVDIAIDLEPVYFDYDKYNIRPDQIVVMNTNLIRLNADPRPRILLEGHCDERGTNEYNLSLGQQRCETVKRFLEIYGVNGARIDIVSYGENLPLCNAQNETCWQLNRRVDITIR